MNATVAGRGQSRYLLATNCPVPVTFTTPRHTGTRHKGPFRKPQGPSVPQLCYGLLLMDHVGSPSIFLVGVISHNPLVS